MIDSSTMTIHYFLLHKRPMADRDYPLYRPGRLTGSR